MPINVVIFEEPDKISTSIDPFGKIFTVNIPNVSRSNEAVDYIYTT
jgi:hypothetical protein